MCEGNDQKEILRLELECLFIELYSKSRGFAWLLSCDGKGFEYTDSAIAK
jgi:hypothetical protein